MYHQLANANTQESYGIESGLDINLFTWWQVSALANLYQYNINSNVQNSEVEKESLTWDARLISSLNFKTGTRIQAIGYYRAAGVDAAGTTTNFYVVNLAANQSLMNGKLNFGISAQNIFNSIDFTYKVEESNFSNTYQLKNEGMTIQLNLSYTFNNFQYKQRGRRDDINFKGKEGF